jgi:hypothetical protein
LKIHGSLKRKKKMLHSYSFARSPLYRTVPDTPATSCRMAQEEALTATENGPGDANSDQ